MNCSAPLPTSCVADLKASWCKRGALMLWPGLDRCVSCNSCVRLCVSNSKLRTDSAGWAQTETTAWFWHSECPVAILALSHLRYSSTPNRAFLMFAREPAAYSGRQFHSASIFAAVRFAASSRELSCAMSNSFASERLRRQSWFIFPLLRP